MSRRRRGRCLLLLVLLAGFAAPSVALELGLRRARACFAAIEGPRAAALPDCSLATLGFSLAELAPWTARTARNLREEVAARWVVMRYIDAAVGEPEPVELEARFGALTEAWRAVENGTGRLWLDDLGRGMAAPVPGALATQAGDRRALTAEGLRWTQWYTSTRAIEAALLNVDLKRAGRLAAHYIGRPNTDLRVRVGALLCAGGEPERAMKQLLEVERGRAADRDANFWRNFGGVRVVIEACAALAGEAPAAVPEYGYAGDWDHRERLLALRWRWARRAAGCPGASVDCGPTARLSAVRTEIRQRLEGPAALAYRLELLALLAPHIDDTEAIEKLGQPRPSEPRLAQRVAIGIDAWVDEPSEAQPLVPAEQLERAAKHIAARASDSPFLRRLAGSLYQHAAKAWAARAMASRARASARRGGELLWSDVAHRALNQSNVAWMLGDVAEARRAVTPSEIADGADSVMKAKLALRRAWLALPDRAAAHRGATGARALARQAERPLLAERAAWLALATSEQPPAQPIERAGLRWPLVGPADSTIPAATRAAELERSLNVWRSWLAAGAEQRRAYRYQAYQQGGGFPAELPAYLLLAGRLVDRAAQVETWLDAMMAHAQSGMTLRRYAWARRVAAWGRGDEEAARRWDVCYRFLLRLSQDPSTAELYRALRL